jgi:cyclic pyranopterin monophosphate synthase
MNMELTHVDGRGNARMVDVSGKDITVREAVAKGRVLMACATIALIRDGKVPKGDVFAVARIAGIMAAKKTPDIIPLSHSLPLDAVAVELASGDDFVEITATVRCTGRTGVEMEALTAVSAAALAVYDMSKAVDKGMVIADIRLMKKTGGRSGTFIRPEGAEGPAVACHDQPAPAGGVDTTGGLHG